MVSIDRSLLPATAEVADDDVLVIGGVRVTDLVDEFGTPLFVYDEDHLRQRCREAVAAFPDATYACKAFAARAMMRLAVEEGLRLDVAGGEMGLALAAGVDPKALVVHGNNKSASELSKAMSAGVHRLVVDSEQELRDIEGHHRAGLPVADVLIRINPGIEVHTHHKIATGVEDSKFGVSLRSGAADRAVRFAKDSPAMRLHGVHFHIGSQVFSAANFADAIGVVAPAIRAWGLPELVVGGGLGVAYVRGEHAPTITEWAEALRTALDSAQLSDLRIGIEPGRAITAAAAVTIYRVGVVKDIENVRTYVAVDGGMSDNPRPVLYGSGYETFDPARMSDPRDRTVTVVGKHCESGDRLVTDASVPSGIASGDLLATPVTGAYGLSLASNYNGQPRPPVVFVAGGRTRLVRRRENEADLTACDVDGANQSHRP